MQGGPVTWSLTVCRKRVPPPVLPGGTSRNPLWQMHCPHLHQLPCVSVFHQNQRSLRLHEGHLCLQCAGPATLPDLHRGPAHQEVPNPVPGGWKWGCGASKSREGEKVVYFIVCSFSHLFVLSFAHSFIQQTQLGTCVGCRWTWMSRHPV